MDELLMALQEATTVLSAPLRQLRVTRMDDDDLCAFVTAAETVGRLIDAARAVAAAAVDERSRWELGTDGLAMRSGHRRSVHLLEALSLVPQAEAARRIAVGAATRPELALDGRSLPPRYPRVAAALSTGTLGIFSAAIILRCLEQARRCNPLVEDMDAAEDSLVRTAAQEPADLVAVHARAWREALDPDGAKPRDEELRRKRGLTVGREINGITDVRLRCDPPSAALIRAALSESGAPGALPRFLDTRDSVRFSAGGTFAGPPNDLEQEDLGAGKTTDPGGKGVPATTSLVDGTMDPRTREQRQFDVLLGLLTAGIRTTDTTPGGLRTTANIMAVVQLSDLTTGYGIGWLDDVAEPVSAATVQELSCDAGFRPVILGEHGEVLYEGRRQRYFTAAQRRALAVRDGGCVWPRCGAPPGWCHAHHVVEWQAGGSTDIDNGVLLCSAHHHMLHNSSFTMRMVHGMPQLLAPPWIDPAQTWRTVSRSRIAMTVPGSG